MIKKVLIIPYISEGDSLKFFVGKGSHSGYWRFPTGHVGDEPHFATESVAQGARRELAEELGIKDTKNFFFTGLKQNFTQIHTDKKRHGAVEESVFAADISGLKVKLDKKEFDEYKLLDIDEALEILKYEPHKKFLVETNEKILHKEYPKIFLIAGPGGGGKGTIIKSLLSDSTINIAKARTATTRPKRPIETDERLFVGDDEFDAMDKNGELIEKNLFGGYWYGSVRKNVEDVLDNLTNVIMEIDLNGVKSFQKLFSNVISIFIKVDLKDLRQRILDRDPSQNIEDIEKRMAITKKEIHNFEICDFVVENKQGELDITVKKIKDIIRRNDGKKE